jgi:putative ABC transport system permease protein
MLKKYLLSTLRILWKNKSHTLINMFGLALGITCSVLIFLILRFELSFDKYHSNRDKIYRLVAEFTHTEKPGYSAGMTYPLPAALRNDFADPDHVIIVDSNLSDPVISVTDENGTTNRFKESKVTFTDPEYFKMFDYEWIEGNEKALIKEKSVVLTASVAKKYFGDKPALNKVINFSNAFDVTVSGVVKDPPINSDFPFRLIFSSRLGADKRGWTEWGAMSSSINCYVQLNHKTTKSAFDAKLDGWHKKYFTGDNEEDGKNRRYFLQPLSEIHFDTRFGNFGGRVVSHLTLLALGFIGILLLLTACINFVNLNTVLIINRAKEAGIRKVMGSTRQQIAFQFLGETFVITVVSLLLSAGFVELALMYLTPVLGYRLEFKPLTDIVTLIFMLGLPFAVTILAGLYPAIILSRFQPVKALKSKLSGNPGQGITLRRALIVFQLVISQVLVVSTIIVIQQLNHFMAEPLGLESNGIVEFELPENKKEVTQLLSDRLKAIPGVIDVSLSNTGSTSSNQWFGDFEATVGNKIIKDGANIKYADAEFVKTYGLKLLYGEDLVPADSATRFLVNEALTKVLGFANPRDAIGVHIDVWGNKASISGIVRDFNTNSLHYKLQPAIILCGTSAYYVGAVKLDTKNLRETIGKIQQAWEDLYPKYVFEYKFLDDTIAQFYQAERRNSYLIGIFAGVAILIGCIGLFGLVSFMAKNKTKEVGIRKTLGATVAQVIILFSKEFIVLIAISFILSTPVAWYFMEQWLENFAYRIHPGVQTFLLGIGVILVVVLGTVGIKSYNAATANPVDALRDE